jgi:hypothetical protein
MGLADGAAPDPAQGLGRYGASASAPRMALLEAKGGRRQRAALEVSVQLTALLLLCRLTCINVLACCRRRSSSCVCWGASSCGRSTSCRPTTTVSE